MRKRHRTELRAGLFINLALALALIALFLFGTTTRIFRTEVSYSFLTSSGLGIIPGTKVLVAGVAAGKVRELSVDNRTGSVRVDFDVSSKYQNAIRADSSVDLVTQGVLGDKAVMIAVGSAGQPILPPGAVIPTRIKPDLSQLMDKGQGLLRDLDRLVLSLNEQVTPRGGSPLISKAASDTMSDISRLARMLERDTIPKLDSILAKLDDGQGTLGMLINDPGIYDDAKAMVGEANSNRILRNIVRKSVEDSKTKPRATG